MSSFKYLGGITKSNSLALCSTVLLAACGSNSEPSNGAGATSFPPDEVRPSNQGNEGEDYEELFPFEGFSGYDGVNTFSMPLVASFWTENGPVTEEVNPEEVTWTVDDPSLADIVRSEPYDSFGGFWALLTTKGAGEVTVTATLGERSTSATVTIANYTADQVAAGRARYYNEVEAVGDRVSCASCHESETGFDHSPTGIAYYPDEYILTIAKDGEAEYGVGGFYMIQTVEHKWNVTPEEGPDLVAFMRSLKPKVLE